HLMLRVIPPLFDGSWSTGLANCLEQRGFKCSGRQTRETFIIDLTKPLPEIRKNFDGKWRNHLSKAERSGITITGSAELSNFDIFEPMFFRFLEDKAFTPPQDVTFFRSVQKGSQPYERLATHVAWHGQSPIAAHLGSFTGDTAVYLLGAATSRGRE